MGVAPQKLGPTSCASRGGCAQLLLHTAGLDALLGSLEARHQAYQHVTYAPIVMAANEDTSTSFALLEFELVNIGPVAGREPSNE